MNVANHKSGKPLASLDWLISHHEAKRDHRIAVVSKWPIRPGSKVLDIATGAGFWIPLIREKIGPAGSIYGIDIEEDLLQQAVIRNPNMDGYAPYQVKLCDMNKLDFPKGSFDVVYAGNCYSYSNDTSKLIAKHSDFVKQNGIFIVRQWDNTATIFSHVDADLLHEILFAACTNNINIGRFDNHMGRNLPSLFQDAKLSTYDLSTDAIQFHAPLTTHEETYLRLKALWFAEQASLNICASKLKIWLDYFEPSSSNYILNKSDFYFSTLEMQIIWTKS
ncbi:methyltransferase domain-containing protein [Alteromonas sp. a30]|nr:methyltransferase domain-containing protein [Alteromonas sp. a30]